STESSPARSPKSTRRLLEPSVVRGPTRLSELRVLRRSSIAASNRSSRPPSRRGVCLHGVHIRCVFTDCQQYSDVFFGMQNLSSKEAQKWTFKGRSSGPHGLGRPSKDGTGLQFRPAQEEPCVRQNVREFVRNNPNNRYELPTGPKGRRLVAKDLWPAPAI